MKTVSSTLHIKLEQLKDMSMTPATNYTAQQLWEHLKTKFKMESGISTVLDVTALMQFAFVKDGNIEKQLNYHQELQACCALNKFVFKDWVCQDMVFFKL